MLAAWGRMKFPHIWDGAIAGSAPIWTFEGEVIRGVPGNTLFTVCIDHIERILLIKRAGARRKELRTCQKVVHEASRAPGVQTV